MIPMLARVIRRLGPHLAYLGYVLRHKALVVRAGLAVRRVTGGTPRRLDGLRFLVRLLVHDWSKFTRAEWGPYVAHFYGPSREERVARARHRFRPPFAGDDAFIAREVEREERDAAARFNAAWLHHLHRNPHHWQHWVLREDSGREVVLTPPAWIVDEMLADWLAAGPKVNRAHSLAEAVAATVAWYTANRGTLLLRQMPRERIERALLLLACRHGLHDHPASLVSLDTPLTSTSSTASRP